MSFQAVNNHLSINRWVYLSAAIVLLWRIAAFLRPSSYIIVADGLAVAMALLGMLFLVCSVYAWIVRPGRWTLVFLLYGVGGGIHWGGSFGLLSSEFERGVLLIYLGFSVLAEAALLHLALIYPSNTHIHKRWLCMLYAPAMLALVIAPIASVIPASMLQTMGGIILLVANLFSIITAVVFITRLFIVDSAVFRASYLALIVGVGITSGVIALFGSAGMLIGNPEAWNLIIGVLPITIAFALTKHKLKTAVVS